MSDYQSIACADYERLEYAALTRQWLEVTVSTGDFTGSHRFMPLDVYTRDGAEWLRATTESGEERVLRLDWLAF